MVTKRKGQLLILSDFESVEPLEMRAVTSDSRIYRSSTATSNIFEGHLSEWGVLAASAQVTSMICAQKISRKDKKRMPGGEMSNLSTKISSPIWVCSIDLFSTESTCT